MKRTIGQAFIFSAIVTALVTAGQIAVGYVRTRYYVPDILNSYENVESLQHQTSFGIVIDGFGIIRFAGMFVTVMIGYILGKTLFDRLRRRLGK